MEAAGAETKMPRRRRGLRRDPPGGWPLDRLLVGVATLRTTRELFILDPEWSNGSPRAWDLSLRTGVSPQGSADALERLRRLGLVHVLDPTRPGRAPGHRIDWVHPLATPLARLFEAERIMVHRRTR